ncbi:MAG: hypothetical protein WCG83_03570 [Candidatus Peregrinibacteria bacterium]
MTTAAALWRKIQGTTTPETKKANEYFEDYLRRNGSSAETLSAMKEIIDEFAVRTPRMFVSKCIDGRVHGSKGKGYPPTTITFSRTEGNNMDTGLNNTVFWRRINRVTLDAKYNTPGVPALFIALGHRSGSDIKHAKEPGYHALGCAAHSANDAAALEAVVKQAKAVRERYRPEELYVLHGMTDTDDMSERLYFPDGTIIDSAEIIETLQNAGKTMQQPADIFTKSFLTSPLDDTATALYVHNLRPGKLLEGVEAPMYRDFQTALAMETYLLREISKAEKRRQGNDIIDDQVFEEVWKRLQGIKELPESLKGPFLYQILWNIAYALYQRMRMGTLDKKEQDVHLSHGETLVCYGDGFEVLSRNKAVLVKTGRGNDMDALNVAKKVLMNNRNHHKQEHPPLVHINVEVSDDLGSFDAFNDQILSKVSTMTQAIDEVFGLDVRILTTYSYKFEKRFYPIQVRPSSDTGEEDPRLSYPVDIIQSLTSRTLTRIELQRRENTFAHMMQE